MSFPKKPVQWQLFPPVTWKMSLATPSMQDYAGSFPDKQHERASFYQHHQFGNGMKIHFQSPHVPSFHHVPLADCQFQQLFRAFPATFCLENHSMFPPPAWHSRLVVVAQRQLVAEFHLGWPVPNMCGCLVTVDAAADGNADLKINCVCVCIH